jgi:hypothetical protein
VREANIKEGLSIQVTNKTTPNGELYNTRMYKCHTRVYPTPKIKCSPRNIILGIKAPSSKMVFSPIGS